MSPTSSPPVGGACVAGTSGSGGDRISQNIYDEANQLLQVRRAVGVSGEEQAYATYSYTLNGKRADIIDANGNHSLQTYDKFDRLFQLQFPSATAPVAFNPASPTTALATAGAVNSSDYEEYGYDNVDNLTSLRKRDGSLIEYDWDLFHHLVNKNLPGGPGPDTDYAYDAFGNRTVARTWGTGQQLDFVYDGFSRLVSAPSLTSSTGGFSRTLSYEYDANGNRTRITHPDGVYFTTEYDGLNRPTVIKENGSTSAITFSYNSHDLRSGLSRGNSTATAYGYDAAERLNSLGQDFASTPSDQTYGFTYNPANQIAQLSNTNSAFVWNIFSAGTTAYAPDGLNRYSAVGGASFTYDANGNLTSDGSTTYAYDVENRLVSSTGAHASSLAYDPNGRLWSLGGGTTTFLYDGDKLIAEYDNTGAVLRRYVHGPNTDEPMIWYEGATLGADRRFLHSNHQGSIAAVSNSAGTATINTYDEYGVQAPSNSGRFQYTGQTWIPDAGLYYYKARMYSPRLGRFMQTDPIGYDDDVNLYAYVGNDPFNKTDPTGRCVYDFCVAETIFAATAITTATQACIAINCIGQAAQAMREMGSLLGGLILEARSKPGPPDPNAEGRPHSIPDNRGGYVTYGPKDPITGEPESTKQLRPSPGKPHGPIERPNIKDRPAFQRPDGARIPGRPVVRPPNEGELAKPQNQSRTLSDCSGSHSGAGCNANGNLIEIE